MGVQKAPTEEVPPKSTTRPRRWTPSRWAPSTIKCAAAAPRKRSTRRAAWRAPAQKTKHSSTRPRRIVLRVSRESEFNFLSKFNYINHQTFPQKAAASRTSSMSCPRASTTWRWGSEKTFTQSWIFCTSSNKCSFTCNTNSPRFSTIKCRAANNSCSKAASHQSWPRHITRPKVNFHLII